MGRNLESYAHKAAKSVVAGWLRAAAQAVGYDEYAGMAGIMWRVNRDGPMWGIWEEYPFASSDAGLTPVWDEYDEAFSLRPPTLDEMGARGLDAVCIADIAIQHKGCITAVVEIIHKHPMDDLKRAFYRANSIEVVELPAAWVLSQTEAPSEIPPEFQTVGWNARGYCQITA